MRGLNDEERVFITENCKGCRCAMNINSQEYSYREYLISTRLIKRGAVIETDCIVDNMYYHSALTSLGKLIVELDTLARSSLDALV